MTSTLTPKLAGFVHYDISWEKFKLLEAAYEGIPGVRLSYCEGELEIVTLSPEHEEVIAIIALLLGFYFYNRKIEFFPTGSYNQIVEGRTNFQSDLSYCLETRKASADLCVEVIFTRGSPDKLKKYLIKGVREVWLWEDGRFLLYHLREDHYEQITRSEVLPDLDLALLTRCVLINSKLQALEEFQNAL